MRSSEAERPAAASSGQRIRAAAGRRAGYASDARQHAGRGGQGAAGRAECCSPAREADEVQHDESGCKRRVSVSAIRRGASEHARSRRAATRRPARRERVFSAPMCTASPPRPRRGSAGREASSGASRARRSSRSSPLRVLEPWMASGAAVGPCAKQRKRKGTLGPCET